MSSQKGISALVFNAYNLYPCLFLYDRIWTAGGNGLSDASDLYSFAIENQFNPDEILLMIKDDLIKPSAQINTLEELEHFFSIVQASNEKEYHKKCKKYNQEFAIDLYDGNVPNSFIANSSAAKSFYKNLINDKGLQDFLLQFFDPKGPTSKKVNYFNFGEWLDASEKFEEEKEEIRNMLLAKFGHKYFYQIDDFVEDLVITQMYKASVVDPWSWQFLDLGSFYKGVFEHLEKECKQNPNLLKNINASNKTLVFGKVLDEDYLRLPWPISYSDLKRFRRDSAHKNLNNWLTTAIESYEANQNKKSSFPKFISEEFSQLASEVQNEISRKSICGSMTLSGFAAYISYIFTDPYIATASALASYAPLNSLFSKYFSKFNPYNFVTYFVKWKRPALR